MAVMADARRPFSGTKSHKYRHRPQFRLWKLPIGGSVVVRVSLESGSWVGAGAAQSAHSHVQNFHHRRKAWRSRSGLASCSLRKVFGRLRFTIASSRVQHDGKQEAGDCRANLLIVAARGAKHISERLPEVLLNQRVAHANSGRLRVGADVRDFGHPPRWQLSSSAGQTP